MTKKRILGAAAGVLLAAAARPVDAAPAAAAAAPWARPSRTAAAAETAPAAPTGRLPLEAEVPADGLRWSIRVGREPMLRAALGTMGGTVLLEVTDPAGAVVHRATVTAVELMDLDARGRSGLWTFSVRSAPGAGAPPSPAGPVPAVGRPRIRFDVQVIEDRGVYAAETPPGSASATETAATPVGAPGPVAPGAATVSAGGNAAALVSSLEAEMARARGGRLDQEGWAILMLLRRYLNLPPPSPPGAPSPAR